MMAYLTTCVWSGVMPFDQGVRVAHLGGVGMELVKCGI